MLKDIANTRKAAEDIITEKNITDDKEQEYIRENIRDFYDRIFVDKSIGISKVTANISGSIQQDRNRITELFKRLNDGGTKLSSYDLVASVLKSFDYRMEDFLDSVSARHQDIGIDKDVLIKLLLVLRNAPNKGMMDLTDEDSSFVINNRKRIEDSLDVLKEFLKASGHAKWFELSGKSSIPLYILAYHIFNQNGKTDKDSEFPKMLAWLKISLLNKVFKRGCGWDPNVTGIRRIHDVMKEHKGMSFPVKELFRLYRDRLNGFIDDRLISSDRLDSFDMDYMFYLIYDKVKSSARVEDKDHIHPKSLLEELGVDPQKISSIGNLQLIVSAWNRGSKNSKEFGDWVKEVPNQEAYMKTHLIPDDSALWYSDRFDDFLSARLELITETIKKGL